MYHQALLVWLLHYTMQRSLRKWATNKRLVFSRIGMFVELMTSRQEVQLIRREESCAQQIQAEHDLGQAEENEL